MVDHTFWSLDFAILSVKEIGSGRAIFAEIRSLKNIIQFLRSHFLQFLWTMIIKLKDWYQTPKSNFDTHGIAQLLAPKFLDFEKVDFSQNHVWEKSFDPLRGSKNGQKFYISKFQKDDSKMFFGLFSNYWVAFWGNPVFNFDFLALFKKWAKSWQPCGVGFWTHNGRLYTKVTTYSYAESIGGYFVILILALETFFLQVV